MRSLADGRPVRVVFFGTPAYAVPALDALVANPNCRVVLVVTQPDRPAGRGRALQPSAVKARAEQLGLPTYQPESLRTPDARAPLDSREADVFAVAAYGLIFGPKTLAIPKLGCLNLHASLLPAYRGASPVTAAILAGDPVTGVTLMEMARGLDSGPIVSSVQVPIDSDDTTGSLTEKLARAGAALLTRDLLPWASGELIARPQPAGATLVRPLVKADGWIDWSQPAAAIERQVRAMQPWPRAWTTLPSGAQLQVLQAAVETLADEPGRIALASRALTVGCGEGALALHLVQPAGSGPMPGVALANGRRVAEGERLGATGAPGPRAPYLMAVSDAGG